MNSPLLRRIYCASRRFRLGSGHTLFDVSARLHSTRLQPGGSLSRRLLSWGAGLKPTDVDIFNPYDGYAPMAQFFLQAFQWHGVKRGDAFAFYAGDIRVEGPHPVCSSGCNLGNERTRTAMYTDSIEPLCGRAGARQVRVRAGTALTAFITPSSGGWIMLSKSPS